MRRPPFFQQTALALVCALCLAAAAQGPHDQATPQFAQLAAAADQARTAGEAAQAIMLYRQALALKPDWTEGSWFLGSLEYATDQYAPAVEDLSHYLAAQPNAAPALALRGLCEFQLADYDHSLADLTNALAHGAANDPNNAGILRLHQALLLTRAGQFEAAFAAFVQLAAQPGAPREPLAVGLGLAGLRVAALPAEAPAQQADLADAAGQAALTWLANAHDHPEQAAQALDNFLVQHPRVPGAHYMFGYLQFSSDPASARAQFQAELTVDPHNAHALAMLGWADLLENNPEGARSWGARAVAADPALPLAQLVLGRGQLEGGDAAAALRPLEQARQLDPDDLEVHLALARAYSATSHPREASEERQRALRMTDDHAP